MKYFKNKILFVFTIAVLIATSCSKLEDLNYNPNKPTEVPTSGLLAQAQANLVYNLNGEIAQLGAQYVQYFAQLDYPDKSNYADDGVSSFNGIYLGGLMDLKEIIDLNTNERSMEDAMKYGEHENQIAVAKILQSWAFHSMTDVWGDIPYSEAIKGGEDILSPKYDTQENIYEGLIVELDEAIAMINTSPTIPLRGDLIFDGNMDMWEAFAESLRLRIAMRLSEVDDAKANQLIDDGDFSNAFQSSDQNAEFAHYDTESDANPLYIDNYVNIGGDYFATANTLIDQMDALNDPRIPTYANQAVNSGLYVGWIYGEAIAGNADDVSMPGDMYGGATAPSILMTAAEVLFIKAEAAQRGYISGDAAQFYNDAITASMEYNGVDATAIATYLAQPEVVYNPATWREQIGTQKWIALYNQGINAWAEWRRLDYPVLTPGPGAVAGATIPRRRAYPSSEYSTNLSNVTEAVERMGGTDLFTNSVWWDK